MSPLLKLPSGSISLLFQSNFNVSKYSLFDMIFWKQPQHQKPGDAHAEQDLIRGGASAAFHPRLVVDHHKKQIHNESYNSQND